MESYAKGGPPALDSSTKTLEFGGPYIDGGAEVVVVGGVVVVVGGVVVVVGGVVVVVGDVVLEVEGPGVSTKYAAIPAMTRITTMTITAVVVLIALCLMIFILVFHKTVRDYKRVSRTRDLQDSASIWLFRVGHLYPTCTLADLFDAYAPPEDAGTIRTDSKNL